MNEVLDLGVVIAAMLLYCWSWLKFTKYQFEERETYAKQDWDAAKRANVLWHRYKAYNQAAFLIQSGVAFDFAVVPTMIVAVLYWIVFDVTLNLQRKLKWNYLGQTAEMDRAFWKASSLLFQYSKGKIDVNANHLQLGFKAFLLVLFSILMCI